MVGTLGDNGWYTSDVTVSWTVTDLESNITGTSDCGSTTLNEDTAATTLTCTATSKGGTSSTSIPLKRDATAPTISDGIFPAPNAAGWNNTDIAVVFTCADNLSGVATCGPNQILVREGAGQSESGTVVDRAGNSASVTMSGINIDKTAPAVNANPAPPANMNGWNNTDVTVSFSGFDALSGIGSCSAPVLLSGEGGGQSASGTCTDMAGNSAGASANGINIDKTAPKAGASVSPSPNIEGWNNAPVTVSFSGADSSGSGIDFCDAAVVLSNEGADQSASGACTDKAGNISAFTTAAGINIDMTAPSISLLAGPENGTSYYFGFVPLSPSELEISVSDNLSGPYLVGIFGYDPSVGTHTMTVIGYDKAGNMSSVSHTYTVLAWRLDGFYQPVDMPTLSPVYNTVKGGSTVPLKFEIFAGADELTDVSAVQSLSTVQVSCTSGAVVDAGETTAIDNTVPLYDLKAGQFVYYWKTPDEAGSCYQVTVKTQDNSLLVAYFKLK